MDKITKITKDLLDQMGIAPKKINLTAGDDGSVAISLDLNEADTGMLIGYHGETIASLQLVLNMIIFRQTGEWPRLIVNIGDYRQKRTDYLSALAEDTANQAIETGEPLALYNLNPFERRIIHTALGEREDVVTESQGAGKQRFLVVSPKNA